MPGPLENMFFDWLYAKVVRKDKSPTSSSSYDFLLITLHNLEFVWLLSGDDTRAEDGKDLRREFILFSGAADDMEWRTMTPCSMLEMIVALSRRAAQQTGNSFDWFWEILGNLSLDQADDASGVEAGEIEDVIEHCVLRQYTPSGDGGLFPLDKPTRDQTRIEIWDQFCDYLVDKDRLP